MAKKKPTKAEREYMSRVAELGCIICKSPAELHHLTGAGMGLRSKDIIPLCPFHHRTGGHGNAIHAGTETWENIFGTQEELRDNLTQLINGQ
ncbi:MAG: Ref family recombination enhancement nuclease [Candidatus Bathyarchaeia archaeon]